jgi:hypothetical protein
MRPAQTASRKVEATPAVIDLCRLYGYRGAHFRPAMTAHGWRTAVAADGKGFPDLLCVGRGRVIAIEVKGATGYPGPEQRAWRDAFLSNGAEWYLVRPDELGRLAGILQVRP